MSRWTPTVKNQRCTRYRFAFDACARCVRACPHEALTVDEQGVTLSPERCRDCGLCLAACPTAALEQGEAIKTAWLRQPPENGTTVACVPSEATGDCRVPCLGALDPVVLARLAAHGVELHLAGSAHCSSCAHAPHGRQRLEALLAMVAQMAARVGGGQDWAMPRLAESPASARKDGKRGMSAAGSDRRQLFRRLGRAGERSSGAGAQGRDPVPAAAIRAAPAYVPLRRWKLAEMVAQGPVALGDELAAALGAGSVASTGGCNGCEACFRACPTGALQVRSHPENATWSLDLYASQCVGCGVCVAVCSSGALAMTDDLEGGEAPTPLYERPQARCQACGRFYIDDGEGCPVCRDDADVMAEIFG